MSIIVSFGSIAAFALFVSLCFLIFIIFEPDLLLGPFELYFALLNSSTLLFFLSMRRNNKNFSLSVGTRDICSHLRLYRYFNWFDTFCWCCHCQLL